MSRTLTNHATRRGVVLTAVLTLFALFGVLPAAQAAPDDIDMSKNGQGSLVITKYTDPAWNKENNGTQQTPPDSAGKALSGVTFTLKPVLKDGAPIDLTKSLSWNEVAGLKFDGKTVTNTARSNLTLGNQARTQKTNNAGLATFSNLDFGVYLVQETDAPANVTRKSEPFFVTIPYPNESQKDGWLYTVYVYPKNGTSTFEKELDAATANRQYKVGDVMVWNLSAQIPNDQKLTDFRLSDKLDASLTYTEGQTPAPVVKLGGQELKAGTDYNVTFENGTVYITFTDTFFKKHLGETVNVALSTTIVNVPNNNVIPNDGANLEFKNVPGGDWNSVPPNENPKANFGDYNIKKVAENQNGVPLTGAIFRVYATKKDAQAGTNHVAESTPSNEDGFAQITDLFLGANDDVVQTYYLREHAAPAGYILSDEVKEITVTKETGKANAGDISIVNKQHDGPDLPLTGATLGVVLPAAGVLLLVGAGIVLAVNKRREKDAA
ncbi:SpaH/EbpB family LPXTG-anchored major pilin [Arcanobacterium canis]